MAVLLAAIGFSSAIIVILCLGDPKRRRASRLAGAGHSTALRRALFATALLPGLFFIGIGNAAGLLIWLGGCAVAGWFASLTVAQAHDMPR